MAAKCAAPSNPIAMWPSSAKTLRPSSAKTLRSRPGPQPKSRIVKGLSLSMCCNNAAMLVVDIFCTKHFAAQFEATVEYVAHRFSVIFAHFLLHLVKGKVRNNITSRSRDFLENIMVDWSGGEHRRGARSAY